jgi:D-serine deaminase-like pyridoxal phosphate-dependent protein
VQVGSYVFMDMQYMDDRQRERRRGLQRLRALADRHDHGHEQPVPRPSDDRRGNEGADAEHAGPADVIGEPDMAYTSRAPTSSAASASPRLCRSDYQIGDKLEVIVPHCDPVVNLYDQMFGIRGDRVEVVWPVTARGASR